MKTLKRTALPARCAACLRLWCGLALLLQLAATRAAEAFTHFEARHTHPLALDRKSVV